MEDAERYLQHPYLAEDPKRLTVGIVVEDPDNPDERAVETARRIEALGAKTEFMRKGVHTFIGRPPVARPPKRDKRGH